MSKTETTNKFDELAPGFLATLDALRTRGFLEDFKLDVHGFDGRLSFITINGNGHIPNDKKYMAEGVSPLADIPGILEKVSAQIKQSSLFLKSCSSTCETTDWKLFDKAGEKVIGKKGSEVKFSFSVHFDTKRKPKAS